MDLSFIYIICHDKIGETIILRKKGYDICKTIYLYIIRRRFNYDRS